MSFVPPFERTIRPAFWCPTSNADWWTIAGQTCVAAYQPKGAASLAASYVNLANPGTYNAAPGVAPTWDAATGWTFNGSTQYLTTGITPTSGWSFFIRFSGAGNNGWLIRATDSAGSHGIGFAPRRYSAGAGYYLQHGNGTLNQGVFVGMPALTSGVAGVAQKDAYLNGMDVGDAQSSFTGPVSPFHIGAQQNFSGAVGAFCAATVLGVAIYSTTLSAADGAALTVRINEL